MPSPSIASLLAAYLAPGIGEAAKTAALGTAVSVARRVGRFSGVQTAHALKPPGAAIAQQVVNPRRSLGNAMTAFRK
jgi:hypothetical protein